MNTVVVGFDGTETAVAALEVAADEARRRTAQLVVVHAWSVPSGAYPMSPLTFVPETARFAEAAQAVLDRAVRMVGGVPHGVRKVLARGSAPDAILEAAGDAEVIVLGSRRRGALGQLLLGSVGQAVVKGSSVPVMIVPPAIAAVAA